MSPGWEKTETLFPIYKSRLALKQKNLHFSEFFLTQGVYWGQGREAPKMFCRMFPEAFLTCVKNPMMSQCSGEVGEQNTRDERCWTPNFCRFSQIRAFDVEFFLEAHPRARAAAKLREAWMWYPCKFVHAIWCTIPTHMPPKDRAQKTRFGVELANCIRAFWPLEPPENSEIYWERGKIWPKKGAKSA